MKRWGHRLVVLLPVLMLSILLAGGCSSAKVKKQKLNVFNWNDYIDKGLIEQFKQQHNADVQYDNYSQDSELETKLLAGGSDYDVVFPSDRSLSPLIKKGALASLDRTRIPNWPNLDPQFLGVRHDPANEYSVPYFWGTLAIGVRTDKVKKPVKGFEILFDKDYAGKIAILDDGEHVVAMTLLSLGKDMNSTKPEDLAAVKAKLLEQKPLIKSYTNDNYKEMLLDQDDSKAAWIVLGWSGDILQAARDNPNIKAIVPESGTLKWIDSMAIPADAPHTDLAYAFINFMLDADVGAQNASAVRYATPNKAARSKLDAGLLNDPAIYPSPAVLNRCQWLQDRGKDIAAIERLWREVKQ